MNANELYPPVTPAIILGICGQTGLVTSFIEHAIPKSVLLNVLMSFVLNALASSGFW